VARRAAARAGEARAAGVTARTVLRVGIPSEEIVSAAKDEHADLVVLSTRGHPGIHRFLAGGVADRVIEAAGCAVLRLRASS